MNAPVRRGLPTTPRALFDRLSARLLILVLGPAIFWRARLAKRLYGRYFDYLEGTSGEDIRMFPRRFAGLQRGRDLAVLFDVAAGHLAWVGPPPGSLPATEDAAPLPGLVSRRAVRRASGIDYVRTDESTLVEVSLIKSITILARFAVARILAPRHGERRPDTFRILGVRIDNHTVESALELIERSVRERVRTRLAFVNPDCLNKAHGLKPYRAALNSMDAVFADGSGLQFAGKLLGVHVRANVNGTDLFPLLCHVCARSGQSLFLLGAGEGIAERTAETMRARHPDLRIVGTHHGFFSSEEEPALLETIEASGADILLVAFGAPRQELWIETHHRTLSLPVMIGVGGLFDFYSGRISRSPSWLRELGLEWTWRLLQEPARMWRRYIIGNPLFVWRVMRQRGQESGGRVLDRYSPTVLAGPLNAVRYHLNHIGYFVLQWLAHAARRALDVLVSGTALLMLTPFLLLTMLAIRLDSRGPIFFAQQRVGKWGVLFNMYKFRSMSTDAETRKAELASDNEMEGGVLFKMKADPRVTRVGRFIRRYSVDELPQFWNVLKGDMALVGPRPPVPAEVASYSIDDRRRLEIKPGITCLWQVSGRSEIPFERQVELDVDYIERHSIGNDLRILLRTVPAVFLGRGAY